MTYEAGQKVDYDKCFGRAGPGEAAGLVDPAGEVARERPLMLLLLKENAIQVTLREALTASGCGAGVGLSRGDTRER